jgi:tetratricopeptide (TPR) repeat protein
MSLKAIHSNRAATVKRSVKLRRGARPRMHCARSAVVLLLTLAPLPLMSQTSRSAKHPSLPPLEILQRAHTFFAQGDYQSARKYYLEVLPSFPKNFDVLNDLAYCYYVTGPRGYEKAAVYYARAYRANPLSAEVANRLNHCYMSLNRYDEAAAVAAKMATLPGAPAEAWKRAAEAYEAGHHMRKARDAYIAYLQREPGDLQARASLARLYGLGKQYAKATEQFRIILSSNPNFPPALAGMARVLSWEGKFGQSLKLYDRVLSAEPDNAEAESGKAFVLLWQGRDEEALALFKQIHQRHPHDAEISGALAKATIAAEEEAFLAAKKAGDTSKIMAFYRERLARNPRDLNALRALTSFNSNLQHCQQSIAFGHRALEISQGAPDVELALARSLALCQDYTEAIDRYQDYLESRPKAQGVLYELGDILLRTHRNPEAVRIFRRLLQVDPQNLGGKVGLGQALAATGQRDQALAAFNQALQRAPDNYDALQGKGYILYYQNNFKEARSIFESLQKRKPGDQQNAQALREIAAAQEEARWEALRPATGASPHAWKKFYEARLASYPNDRDALKGLAYVSGELHDTPAAIQGYQRVLALYPGDRDAQTALARLLRIDGKYAASIKLYREILISDPDNPKVLGDLAQVEAWAGQDREALEIYQRLLASDPSNTGYLLKAGQLHVRLKKYAAAKKTFAALLAEDPQSYPARLEIAQLELKQGDLQESGENFDALLKQNPKDPAALAGKADIEYREGRLPDAEASAAKAISAQPDNFTALVLMASIQNARRHRREALQLLERAERISPGNAEVALLENEIRSESTVTIHTSASYAREIGRTSQPGSSSGLPNEDLRMFSYGTTVGFFLLPRVNSYLTFTAMPSESPPGPLRDVSGNQLPTGITGAVAPSMLLYRQEFSLTKHLTLHTGGGMVRFGPGNFVALTGQPVPIQSASQRALWQAGLTYGFAKRFNLDILARRLPIAYTPLSTRFGTMEDEYRAAVHYFPTSRTQLHIAYAYGIYSTEKYDHVSVIKGSPVISHFADTDRAHYGSLDFSWNLYRSGRFSLDGGYEGVMFGFTRGSQHLFGFYNPDFYQRHEFAPRIYGQAWGPVGYDIRGGFGVQQASSGGAFTRAFNVNPELSFRVTRHLLVTLGYMYYNTAQALGPLRGNAVSLATDWKY